MLQASLNSEFYMFDSNSKQPFKILHACMSPFYMAVDPLKKIRKRASAITYNCHLILKFTRTIWITLFKTFLRLRLLGMVVTSKCHKDQRAISIGRIGKDAIAKGDFRRDYGAWSEYRKRNALVAHARLHSARRCRRGRSCHSWDPSDRNTDNIRSKLLWKIGRGCEDEPRSCRAMSARRTLRLLDVRVLMLPLVFTLAQAQWVTF